MTENILPSSNDSSNDDNNILLASLLQCLIEERFGDDGSVTQESGLVLRVTCLRLSSSGITQNSETLMELDERNDDITKNETINDLSLSKITDENMKAEAIINVRDKIIHCEDEKVKDILESLFISASQSILPLKFDS